MRVAEARLKPCVVFCPVWFMPARVLAKCAVIPHDALAMRKAPVRIGWVCVTDAEVFASHFEHFGTWRQRGAVVMDQRRIPHQIAASATEAYSFPRMLPAPSSSEPNASHTNARPSTTAPTMPDAITAPDLDSLRRRAE